MKKFFDYLKKNNITITLLIIFLCSITFLIAENVEFQSHFITYINLMAYGVLAVIFFYATRKHHIRWSVIICIFLLIFIFNRYYDESVFLNTFHFRLLYFFVVLAAIVVFAILYPFIKEMFMRLSDYLGEWTKYKSAKDEQRRKELEKRYKNRKEKRAESRNAKEQFNSKLRGMDDTGKSHDIGEIEKSKELVREDVLEKNQLYENNLQKHQLSNDNIQSHPILFTLVFIALLVSSVALLFVFYFVNASNFFINITSRNLPTVILSFVITFMMLVFVVGMIVSLFFKWTQIIIGIIKKQHKGEMYFVFACCLFLFSQYIFNNYSYTTDDFANLLLGGNLFTFPLILSILVPIFLIFAENIISFSTNNPEIVDALNDCTKQTIKIARGIIKSLLTFIEFVTSDYLSSIIELTKENDCDIESEETVNDDRQKEGEDLE